MKLPSCSKDSSLTYKSSFRCSDLADGVPKLDFFEQLQGKQLLTEKTRLQLELVFQEALINAVEHGNLELHSNWKEDFDRDGGDAFSRIRAERLKNDKYAEREVQVELSFKDSEVTIILQDEGNGFCYNNSLTQQDDLLKLYGRGFDIIYGVVDQVEFFDQGRGILMKKKLSR